MCIKKQLLRLLFFDSMLQEYNQYFTRHLFYDHEFIASNELLLISDFFHEETDNIAYSSSTFTFADGSILPLTTTITKNGGSFEISKLLQMSEGFELCKFET